VHAKDARGSAGTHNAHSGGTAAGADASTARTECNAGEACCLTEQSREFFQARVMFAPVIPGYETPVSSSEIFFSKRYVFWRNYFSPGSGPRMKFRRLIEKTPAQKPSART
jgi:hypothetical protein